MMKKSLAILLAVLFLFALAGCKDDGYPSDTLSGSESRAYSKQGELVTDNAYLTVRAIELFDDPYFGKSLKLYIKNKSLFQSYDFSVMEASVDGVEWSPFSINTVEPGKSKLVDINWTSSKLAGIVTGFTDVELLWTIQNSSDDKTVESGTFHYYPNGKENAKLYDRTDEPDDVVLYDNETFKVTLIGYDPQGSYGYTVKLYIENKTDIALSVAAFDTTVNGKPYDPFWAHKVPGHLRSFTEICFPLSDLEALGITDVETIAMTFGVYESDTLANVFSEQLTLRP